MKRVRITRLSPLILGFGVLAGVMTGLGTAVALWTTPAVAPRHPEYAAGSAPCQTEDPCLAIVIDDVGRDLAILKRLLNLRLDLTYSVLPHAQHTTAAQRMIRARGREILLHLPMQPHDRTRITDEEVVLGRDGPLRAALSGSLARVPDAAGANNHMGSALCESPEAVREVLLGLKQRGLWFLDSRTSGLSVFCQQAGLLGVPCVERDVFLDHPPRPGVQLRRLARGVRTARRRGWAVAIGHPHASTARLLSKVQKSLASTIRVRRLSVLVREDGANGT